MQAMRKETVAKARERFSRQERSLLLPRVCNYFFAYCSPATSPDTGSQISSRSRLYLVTAHPVDHRVSSARPANPLHRAHTPVAPGMPAAVLLPSTITIPVVLPPVTFGLMITRPVFVAAQAWLQRHNLVCDSMCRVRVDTLSKYP